MLGGEGNRSTRASSELGCSQLHAQTQACTETPTATTHRVASDRQTDGPNDRQLHVLPMSTDTLWVRRGLQPRGDSRVPPLQPRGFKQQSLLRGQQHAETLQVPEDERQTMPSQPQPLRTKG